MQYFVSNLIIVIMGYGLGCLLFSFFIAKLIYKTNLTTVGSNNPGATNLGRIFGWRMFIIGFSLDAGKAIGAILIANLLYQQVSYFHEHCLIYLAGGSCIVGHLFPIWRKGKGGKGISCMFGCLIMLNWQWGLMFIGIFGMFFLVYRKVSIANCISVAIICLFLWANWFDVQFPDIFGPYPIYIILDLCGVLILWCHLMRKLSLFRVVKSQFQRFK